MTRLNQILLVVWISFLTLASSVKITGHAYGWDPLENTVASLNLLKTGTIADVYGKPTNLREPLPILMLAAHIALVTDIPYQHKRIADIVDAQHYRKQITQVNLYYVFATLAGVCLLMLKITRSSLLAALAAFLTWLFFLNSIQHLYSPHTEIAASMLIVWIAITSLYFYEQPTLLKSTILGVLLGCLGLTKMPASYVALAFIPAITLVSLMGEKQKTSSAFKCIAVTMIAFTLVLSPWIVRNRLMASQSNSNIQSAISQRGGAILHDRANAAQQVVDHASGYVYLFAPSALKSVLFEKWLGFKRQDLWPNGRYDVARLDRPDRGFREEAIRAGAVSASSQTESSVVSGLDRYVNPGQLFADDERKQARGIHTILAQPLLQAESALIFAWRGMWSFSGKSHPPESYSLYHVGNYLPYVIANAVCFVLFLLLPWIAIAKRRYDWLAFALFGNGMFWIYALFSHFIPRYSAPLIPLTIVATLMLIHATFRRGNP